MKSFQRLRINSFNLSNIFTSKIHLESCNKILYKPYATFAKKDHSTKRNKAVLDYSEYVNIRDKNLSEIEDLNPNSNIEFENNAELKKLNLDDTEIYNKSTPKNLKKSNPKNSKKRKEKITNPVIDIHNSDNITQNPVLDISSLNNTTQAKKEVDNIKPDVSTIFIKKTEKIQEEDAKERLVYKESTGKLEMVPNKPLETPKKNNAVKRNNPKNQPEVPEKFEEKVDEKFMESYKYVEPERISKYLSRAGVSSRRQAEKMIEKKLVKVNNKIIDSNMIINPLLDKVSIIQSNVEKFPTKGDTKIWIFYKPMQLICDERDPHGRKSIFDYIKGTTKIKEHIISVGRLDFLSEGLMILTNDGELARAMELPENKIERKYRVRVYGRFNDEKLLKIRAGAVINGKQYGPFYCNVEKYQTSNTWLEIKMEQGKNREIKRVMQKNQLRVNRLIRQSYGEYSLEDLKPGELREVTMTKELVKMQYLHQRKKQQQIEELKREKIDTNSEVVLIGNTAKKLKEVSGNDEVATSKHIDKSIKKSLLQQVRMISK